MFRPRHRSAFTNPLNWTDYRWDAGPWGAGSSGSLHGARRWRHAGGPWKARAGRFGHPLVLVFLAGIAALIGAKLLSGVQTRNTSWARRAVYGVVLLLIVGAFSRNRRNRWL